MGVTRLLCSRLFVTPLASPCTPEPDFAFAKRGFFCSFSGQIAVNSRAKLSESPVFNEVMRFVFNNFSALRAPFFNNSLVFKYFLASFRQRPFVSNNIVASFVLFFVFFRARLPGSSEPHRLSLALLRAEPLAYDNVSTSRPSP